MLLHLHTLLIYPTHPLSQHTVGCGPPPCPVKQLSLHIVAESLQALLCPTARRAARALSGQLRIMSLAYSTHLYIFNLALVLRAARVLSGQSLRIMSLAYSTHLYIVKLALVLRAARVLSGQLRIMSLAYSTHLYIFKLALVLRAARVLSGKGVVTHYVFRLLYASLT